MQPEVKHTKFNEDRLFSETEGLRWNETFKGENATFLSEKLH